MSFRAVIYARCSTEEESQKNALQNQVAEAEECVRQMGWQLTDVYVESRSGTTTKGRSEYKRLFEDLLKNVFDVIVIKSQDRLMRNTKDWYLFVDRLVTEQKKLYFYIEQKYYSHDDNLLTGIKAILAEEYSRELSKKINLAHQNRQKHDGAVIITNQTYGYKKLPDKSVVIDEEEAKISRRMYELCAAGLGSRSISAVLQNEGMLNRNGKPFTSASILRIIHSPLNKGTVVMNREHFDFDSKKMIKVPKDKQYIYENKVPAIVTKELWEQANRQIEGRRKKSDHSDEICRGNYSGKSLISGRIYCGICGSPYYRKSRYKNEKKIHEWKCKKYLEYGRKGCVNVSLDEKVFYQLLEKELNGCTYINREKIIYDMEAMLSTVFEKDVEQMLIREKENKYKIEEKMNILVNKLLDRTISDDIYQKKQLELVQKSETVRKKIECLEMQKLQNDSQDNRIFYIEKMLREDKIVEKAVVSEILETADKILIYPSYLKIHFSLSDNSEGDVGVLRVEYGDLFNYKAKKQKEREDILNMIRDNPYITAKKVAERANISLSGANYRMRMLKKEGKICFEGKGGKGKWVVIEHDL